MINLTKMTKMKTNKLKIIILLNLTQKLSEISQKINKKIKNKISFII